jgi:DNA-directed RNA polymerase specialized sigma subunit
MKKLKTTFSAVEEAQADSTQMEKLKACAMAVEAKPRPQECGKGRPKALSDGERALALGLYFDEGLPVRTIADALGVSHMTVWRTIAALPSLSAGADN